MQCVECGAPVAELYRRYPSGNTLLKSCPLCKQPADRYVECSFLLVVLDLLLQKPQAYRHVIKNRRKVFSSSELSVQTLLRLTLLAYTAHAYLMLEQVRNDCVLGKTFLESSSLNVFFVGLARIIFADSVGVFCLLGIDTACSSVRKAKKKNSLRDIVLGHVLANSLWTLSAVFIIWPCNPVYGCRVALVVDAVSNTVAYHAATGAPHLQTAFCVGGWLLLKETNRNISLK
ncbi:MAG: Arv1-like family protein [Amphiamblys sp. WSBS2006]|nr:MAG: Arv1-like family protein [Amphiamblys sp. WSBS2006]